MPWREYIRSIQHRFESSWYTSVTELFFKGWYAIVLVKLMLLGPLLNELMLFQQVLGEWNVVYMTSASPIRWLMMFILLLGIVLPRHYLLSLIMFLVVLWAHRLIHPVVNGGDLVILFYMFLGVFCNDRPRFPEVSFLRLSQISLNNFCILIAKLQVAMIYLVSGWDKIISQEWRDGSAMYNLLQVDFYSTDWVRSMTSGVDMEVLQLVSWLVIVFELLFPILVWFKTLRYGVLLAGICFHLFIGFGLSLPDFALVMIWSYLIFVRPEDYMKFSNRLRKLNILIRSEVINMKI